MTPKEKAEELFDKFINYSQQCINDEIINQFNLENPTYKGSKFVAMMRFSEKHNAKQCALIAVEEIVNQFQSMSDTKSVLFVNDEITYVIHHLVYWQEVKQEIEKL